MAATFPDGPESWGMSTDERGYRDYKIVYRVKCDVLDGPSVVLATVAAAIPIGTVWVIGNEVDPWAWRRPEVDLTPVQTKEPNNWFDVTLTFSNRPVEQDSFTSDPGSTPPGWDGGSPTTPAGGGVENPLLVPDRVSGGTTTYTEEAKKDRLGRPLVNSAFEPLKGPPVEFDKSRATVKITQNRASLDYTTLLGLVNCLNNATLWGSPARTVKFSNFSWERKYYAGNSVYYERTLEFEIREDTFDRDVLDEGTKALSGHWVGHDWVLDKVGFLENPRKPEVAAEIAAGLQAGSYQYRVTALDGEGNETLPSPPAELEVPEDGAVALISWPKVTGASAYNLYRTNPDLGTAVIAQTTDLSFIDDLDPVGTVADLPTENTTGVTPDPLNPRHYNRYKDRNSENARTVLDGAGKPIDVDGEGDTNAGYNHVEYYASKSFAPLGLPASL